MRRPVKSVKFALNLSQYTQLSCIREIYTIYSSVIFILVLTNYLSITCVLQIRANSRPLFSNYDGRWPVLSNCTVPCELWTTQHLRMNERKQLWADTDYGESFLLRSADHRKMPDIIPVSCDQFSQMLWQISDGRAEEETRMIESDVTFVSTINPS